ncbi:hypothetical protein J2046_002703 [Rhizobium petrolearium]|uniref:hypothetical protein n=1 Tax=Neorhizobium petrolearium TaxID=515361 RepID=UPI001AE8D273|nr:hypothetical protein [Neorhizobium petrolearium]MBP1844444.1 hypothetical protein [Neorhizobium petrolearium]
MSSDVRISARKGTQKHAGAGKASELLFLSGPVRLFGRPAPYRGSLEENIKTP